MPNSIADEEYADLRAVYGNGLSIQDMRMLDMRAKLTGEDPLASVSDLEALYLDQQVPGSGMSRTDNENAFYGGGNSLSDDKYLSQSVITNMVDNGYPANSNYWASDDPVKWAISDVPGEITITRGATADALVTAQLWRMGLAVAGPTLEAGKKYQRSVEIFSTVPVNVVQADSSGFSWPSTIPANTWTKVVSNFTGTGGAMFYSHFKLVALSDPGTGPITKIRKLFVAEYPHTPELAYADGSSPGWTWVGAPNMSFSTGPPAFQPPVAGPLITIDQWMSTTPFFAGHRGEAQGYPEHTAESYAGAFADGAKALEWSIQMTSQSTFYHMHDIGGGTGLTRTTNGTGDVLTKTNAEMDALVVDTIDAGPYWPTANIRVPKFLDMMNLYYNKVVILLETKDYTAPAVDALFTILNAQFPGYQQSIIWKQHVGGGSVPYGMQQAAANGMKIWAYIDAPLDGTQQANAIARGDFIGIPRSDVGGSTLTDAEVDTVIAAAGAKKVLAWAPTRRGTRDNLVTRGVDGFVTPAIRYMKDPHTQGRQASDFGSGKWAVGDHNFGTGRELSLGVGQDYARIAGTLSGQGICLGSFCPTPASSYAMIYEVMYEVLPTAANFTGLAFGKASDAGFQVGQTTNPDGGYILQSLGDGMIRLTRHAPNNATNTAVGTTLTGSWPAGSYMKIKVVVNAGDIKFQRQDGTPSAVITVTDATYRGSFMYLVRNHGAGTGEIARYKNIQYTTDLSFL